MGGLPLRGICRGKENIGTGEGSFDVLLSGERGAVLPGGEDRGGKGSSRPEDGKRVRRLAGYAALFRVEWLRRGASGAGHETIGRGKANKKQTKK